MTRFLLDTNAVRHFLDGKARLIARMRLHRPRDFCISVVTEAEMRFGVARLPDAASLNKAVAVALATFETLAWTSATAKVYGDLRADLERQGRPLAPLDMMIAAQAVEGGAVLVTSDRALLAAPGVACEDWLD